MALSDIRSTCFAFLCTVALAAPAVSAATITAGNQGSLADENIQFREPGLASTGLIVEGLTNQTDTVFEFESNETLVNPASGQARVEAQDGIFNTLVFRPADPTVTFTSLVFNINLAGNGTPGATGDATIVAVEVGGEETTATFTGNAAEGFFTVKIDSTVPLTSVRFTSTFGFQDIAQFRVGGVAVPEPMALAAATLGLPLLARRRR